MDNIKKIVGSRLKDLRSNKSQSELCISLNREYQKRYDTDEKPFTQAKISKIEKLRSSNKLPSLSYPSKEK